MPVPHKSELFQELVDKTAMSDTKGQTFCTNYDGYIKYPHFSVQEKNPKSKIQCRAIRFQVKSLQVGSPTRKNSEC